jgi:hypothetical protein
MYLVALHARAVVICLRSAHSKPQGREHMRDRTLIATQ